MGRIVKTPAGKYAAFSDIVDHFVAYGMTREQAVQFCIDDWDLGPRAALGKVSRADEDHTMSGGIGRYEESLHTISIIHGDAEARKYRQIMETQRPASPRGDKQAVT